VKTLENGQNCEHVNIETRFWGVIKKIFLYTLILHSNVHMFTRAVLGCLEGVADGVLSVFTMIKCECVIFVTIYSYQTEKYNKYILCLGDNEIRCEHREKRDVHICSHVHKIQLLNIRNMRKERA